MRIAKTEHRMIVLKRQEKEDEWLEKVQTSPSKGVKYLWQEPIPQPYKPSQKPRTPTTPMNDNDFATISSH